MCLCEAMPVYRDGNDIKVYKVVKVIKPDYWDNPNNFSKVFYESPYYGDMQGSMWEIGRTNAIESPGPEYETFDGMKRILGCAFHSFYHLEDAVHELEDWQRCSPKEYTILECVIPANTEYVYFGWFYKNEPDEPVPAYASQSLIPVRALSKEELSVFINQKWEKLK